MTESPKLPKLDRLAAFLEAFSLSASVQPPGRPVDGPCLRVVADEQGAPGGLVLCLQNRGAAPREGSAAVTIAFDNPANPLMGALPPEVRVHLAQAPALKAITEVLLGEIDGQRCGRATALDRLAEVLVLMLLREVIESGARQPGLFAALAHPQLHRALVAMHDQPARPWTVVELAEQAAMSRTQFMGTFRRVVGTSPMAYLGSWRLSLAARALDAGHPVKSVARRVGFQSAAAFSRAYSRTFGRPPVLDRARAGAKAP